MDLMYQFIRGASRHFSVNWEGSELWSLVVASYLSRFQKVYPLIAILLNKYEMKLALVSW